MALDPEVSELYANARLAYDDLRSREDANSPAVLEAQEEYREALAAYVLDLEVNGMTVPEDLLAVLAGFGESTDPAPEPGPPA